MPGGRSAWVRWAMTGLLLASCSGPPLPDGEAGRAVLTRLAPWKDLLDGGLVVLEGFEKRDGQRGRLFGVDTYSLEYVARLRYVAPVPASRLCGFPASPPPPCSGQPGARAQTLSGVLLFERTERGWRGEDGIVYR